MPAKVIFVGAGCGDPRLLTIRAVEVLAEAEYVLFDPLVHADVLGRLAEGTPLHPVSEAMTADRIGSMLADQARAGRRAVRLTMFDPLFFGGSDAEAAAVVRHGARVEIVPGVTPFVAAGAYAGTPLTRSTDASPSLAVVGVARGHESLHDWEKLATATDTIAIISDAESIAETARSLVFYGRDPGQKVTLVENVSLPSQRVIETTLGAIPQLSRARAAKILLVAGARAQRMPELAWFERQPLFGKRVLVTRAREQAGSADALLRDRGADPVVMPTIEIHPPSDPAPLIDAAANLSRYGVVALTSANGAERLLAEVKRQGKDARAFAGCRLAAIGPGTAAALERWGLAPDVLGKEAKDYRGEGLATGILAALESERPRVLVARAEVARDALPDVLRAAGCEVDVVAAYKTRSPPRILLEGLAALLETGEIDAVIFTSSSTVDHLCDALEARAAELLAKTSVASIGPITSETARRRGLRIDVEAEAYTIPGLVAALERHFAPKTAQESAQESS